MPLFTGKIPVKRGVFIFKEMDLADLSPFEDGYVPDMGRFIFFLNF